MDANKRFEIGGIYFQFGFVDDEYHYPIIDSLVFIGKNIELDQDDRDLWYFQDPQSYVEFGAYSPKRNQNQLPQEKSDGLLLTFQEDSLAELHTAGELIHRIAEFADKS